MMVRVMVVIRLLGCIFAVFVCFFGGSFGVFGVARD